MERHGPFRNSTGWEFTVKVTLGPLLLAALELLDVVDGAYCVLRASLVITYKWGVAIVGIVRRRPATRTNKLGSAAGDFGKGC
jgi:hypothetical protein